MTDYPCDPLDYGDTEPLFPVLLPSPSGPAAYDDLGIVEIEDGNLRIDPLLEEAELHADAELSSIWKDVEAGFIPEEDYHRMYREAVARQLRRLRGEDDEP